MRTAAAPRETTADGTGKATARPPNGARRLLTDIEAAEYCGVSRSYLRAQVAAGRIPRVKLPSVDGARRARVWRVDRGDLDRWIERLKT